MASVLQGTLFLIEALYAEPEEDPIEEGEAADPAAATPESEVTG